MSVKMSVKMQVANVLTRRRWKGSADYWERRYATGGTSGDGSYGRKAEYKAGVVNRMVKEQDVHTVIELGCGDGNQLTLAQYPKYLGLDVSPTAIEVCQRRFADDDSKSFLWYSDERFTDPGGWIHADLAMSLEVIFHLVEDEVYHRYMKRLFTMADRQVIVCASDRDDLPRAPQERHRRFTTWVADNQPNWRLVEDVPPAEGLYAGFYRYERMNESAG